MTGTLRLRHGSEPEPGYEWQAVEETGWVVDHSGRRCRRAGWGGRDRCPNDAVAVYYRGNQPWRYCGEHMYGRWIEDGRVMHWVVRKVAS